MLLNHIKSQPKISFLDNVELNLNANCAKQEALTIVPNWTRSASNLDHNIDYSKNVKFGRHNAVVSEDYYRTLKEFKTAKINDKKNYDETDDKENIVELPESVIEAFYQKLTIVKQNTDLGMSPQSEKHKSASRKKRRSRSSNPDLDVIDRLYMSPSPFHSPENLKKCYATEKGRKRLRSAISVRIPKKTLYAIDKVIRKKLRKEKQKLKSLTARKNTEFNKSSQHTLQTVPTRADGLSPRFTNEQMMQVHEEFNFKTPEKPSSTKRSTLNR